MKQKILTLILVLVSVTSALFSAPINVACVGDSITVGYPDSSQSYPIQLQALFDARDGVGAYNVRNFGVSGRTLRNDGDFPYMNDYWYTASLESDPDIVIIMLGTNDAKVGINWNVAAKDGANTSITIYNADYVTLIDSYRALSPTPEIYVCTPIPVCTVGDGGTFGVSGTVISDEIVPAVRSTVTAPADVGLIELNAIFPVDQTSYYAVNDKVHPSPSGYGFIAEKIYSAIKSVPVIDGYHVSKNGSDSNDGSYAAPFLTIQHAADIAQAGDVITVHAGVYRERINPPRGGTSDEQRIVYQAAPGEEVVIKGSEPISGWVHVGNDTWKVKVPNTYFGDFNPFRDALSGDWYVPIEGRVVHSGSVYLEGHWLWEAKTYSDVLAPAGDEPYWFTNDKENVPDDGTAEGDEATMTTIWAQFKDVNPNEAQVEINKRQAVFYPDAPGRDFITVRGFILEHAATPWAPPTYEQIGLIGCHWSKGWIIEDNIIRYSACTGLTLGKYYDPLDNWDYHAVIQRSLLNGWNKETVGSHVVRNNHISHCEMAGIVGSLGPIFSTISGNTIHDIHVRKLFTGYEMAGIKLHGAVDCLIENNNITRTAMGIWLDWMAQGTQVRGNFLAENERDMFYEVNHGPFLVDNNVLASQQAIRSVSRGGAYAHNLILGEIEVIHTETRAVPYLVPHGTDVVEYGELCPSGDEQYYNNIFYGYGLDAYDIATLPVTMAGNVFLNGAVPSIHETGPIVDNNCDAIRLVPEADGAYLYVEYDVAWRAVDRSLVTTDLLGSALITGGTFEHPDGSPYLINQDLYGVGRNVANPCVGPFVFTGSESNRFKIYSYDTTGTSTNVLAHWSFDDAAVSGQYEDASGNGLDIDVTVAPTHITSDTMFGSGALEFTAGQYLTLPDSPSDGTAALPLANNSFSVSFWVKRTNTAVNQMVIGMSDPRYPGSSHPNHRRQALHLGFRTPTATIDFYDDGLDHSHTPTDTTTWHHYVMTYDADINEQQILIDGDLLTKVRGTSIDDFLGDINENTTASDVYNDFWIGKSFSGANFDGLIDEVWVFDAVLSPFEIYNLYANNQPTGVIEPTSMTVSTFTGGDVGEGLDLNGDYAYTVNIAGNAQYPPVVQGYTFLNDTLTDGVTVTLGGSGYVKFEYWGTQPVYGDSGNDNWLEVMMHATALSYGTAPIVEVDLEVTAGQRYELLLLFSENAQTVANSRKFDIAVEGVAISDEFTSIPAGAEWSSAPHLGVVLRYEFVAGDEMLNLDFTSGASGDVNPLIQALTLKEVATQTASSGYTAWAASVSNEDIGPETNDPDGDSKNNFHEYAFGGDPMDPSATAQTPVIEVVNGEFRITHAERTSDTQLRYSLQASTTLAPDSWDDFAYEWIDTSVTGGQFNAVTHRILSAEDNLFIRLVVDRN